MSRQLWVLCWLVCWSSGTAEGALPAPRGFLTANGAQFPASGARAVYWFRAGESLLLTCHKTAGALVSLYYTTADGDISSKSAAAPSVTMRLQLRATNHNSTATCVAYDPLRPLDQHVVQLALALRAGPGNVWVVVFSVLGSALLVALVLWAYLAYRGRTQDQHPSVAVVFGERNSFENLSPRAERHHADRPTYLTVQNAAIDVQSTAQTDAFVKNWEPTVAFAKNGELTEAFVKNAAPTNCYKLS